MIRTKIASLHASGGDHSGEGTARHLRFLSLSPPDLPARGLSLGRPTEKGWILLNEEGEILELVNFSADDYYLSIDELLAVLEAIRNGQKADIRY